MSRNNTATALYRVVTEDDESHLTAGLHRDGPTIEKWSASHPPSVDPSEVALTEASPLAQRR